MLELKTEFNLGYDAGGYITEPHIHDITMSDVVIVKNSEDFGVVIKLQYYEENPFFLSFEGCINLNVSRFMHTNLVSYILLHSTEELLLDDDLVASDFELKHAETKLSVRNWIKKSRINRIRIGPDAGAEIVIYCEKIRAYK